MDISSCPVIGDIHPDELLALLKKDCPGLIKVCGDFPHHTLHYLKLHFGSEKHRDEAMKNCERKLNTFDWTNYPIYRASVTAPLANTSATATARTLLAAPASPSPCVSLRAEIPIPEPVPRAEPRTSTTRHAPPRHNVLPRGLKRAPLPIPAPLPVPATWALYTSILFGLSSGAPQNGQPSPCLIPLYPPYR